MKNMCIICKVNETETKNSKTCSQKCRSKLSKENSKTILNCKICDTEFIGYKFNKNGYCSDECRSKRKYTRKNCSICNVEFLAKKKDVKTCSPKCRLELINNKKIKTVCKNCKKQIEIPSYYFTEKRNYYCSDECKSEYYPNVNPNHTNNKYGPYWGYIRECILNRDKHCLKCLSVDKLQVHHFIKMKTFKNVEQAHYFDNLGTFCKDCHLEIEKLDFTSYTDFCERYSLNSVGNSEN